MQVNPKNLLPNLAYVNDFALNPQYFELVPGCLIAKDEYAAHLK